MNKKCVKNAFRCRESPSVSDSANSVIVNFHKKRSVPKEIPSEVGSFCCKDDRHKAGQLYINLCLNDVQAH